MAEVTVSEAILEKLRCSICTDYLSCGPIKVSSDGGSICGRCLPSDEAEPTYRNLILEAIIGKLSFPCKFRAHGCEERFPYGQTNEHDKNCNYSPLPCPVSSCLWGGLISQLAAHFSTTHSVLVKNAEFELCVNQDKPAVLMIVVIDEIPFLIKFKYSSNEGDLHYNVSCVSSNMQEATYKIRLTNNRDRDYSINLKGDLCLPYNLHTYAMSNLKSLSLKKHLPSLEDPDSIIVAILIEVKKSKVKLIVNYKAMDSLRCGKCRGYLVPPIYDSTKGTICANCCTTVSQSTPSTNEELKRLVLGLNYPCRWQGCDRIEKGGNIHTHEEVCRFRMHNCPDCKTTFNLDTAENHLMTHGYQHVDKEIIYSTKFQPEIRYEQFREKGQTFIIDRQEKFFVFRNNDIIYITRQTVQNSGYGVQNSVFGLQSSAFGAQNPTSSFKITLKCDDALVDLPVTEIYFKHSHCKVRSKIFTAGMSIAHTDLPTCFTLSDVLTATLNIE